MDSCGKNCSQHKIASFGMMINQRNTSSSSLDGVSQTQLGFWWTLLWSSRQSGSADENHDDDDEIINTVCCHYDVKQAS